VENHLGKDWPYKKKGITYILSSPKVIAGFIKSRKSRVDFVKGLKEMGDIPVKRKVVFQYETFLTDVFIYVADSEGVQTIFRVELEDDFKKPIDFSQFDA